MSFFKNDTVESELSQKIDKRVIQHRDFFYKMINLRYKEILPCIISYKNIEDTSIDFLRLEMMLRDDYYVAIGKNSLGKICILGYLKNRNYESNLYYISNYRIATEKDIYFTIPKKFRLKNYTEISVLDDCQTGNFIVVKNKVINNISDMSVINFYAEELAEIITSRYSLSIQSKFMTLFIGEYGDETINQLVSDFYNGSPFTKTTKYFDPDEQILNIDNSNLSTNLAQLKSEYQNKIGELNNYFGIDSLGVDKKSGVSDEEANSNNGFTDSNGNIYLTARENEFKKLNKRFDLKITCMLNDNAVSELTKNIEKEGNILNE